jgi:hypothetical protein
MPINRIAIVIYTHPQEFFSLQVFFFSLEDYYNISSRKVALNITMIATPEKFHMPIDRTLKRFSD